MGATPRGGFDETGGGTGWIGRTARPTLRRTVADGVAAWDRATMLPRLIPVGSEEIADESRDGRLAIMARLARALRGERVRGRAGHWSYSLDRHIGLVQAMAAERAMLGAMAADGAGSDRWTHGRAV